ncbi:hypothetical protein BWI93_04275 [Siphonobacter sp. BAB-5385]|uniref:cupin domain-containing protein n=1 Tax=unclassified Siphonobacter TaxID=2635712 RepID=UPI000B9E9613|nr:MULTISPECIES: cupin domain-containing protein [unclassified Siphonobacter]OZI09416.1 hypothetical protein BWI93_04275 [Siphonobacter sp. BAB-5385]PMD98876.1 hypothetical protein BWI97_02795 [Siphonobacter sp. BAB-5405]
MSVKTSIAASRTIRNPMLKDEVVFLETSLESQGQHTLVEVTLSAGGGNPLHFHRAFSEEFTCLEGELGIQLGKQMLYLKPGESAMAPAMSRHRFFNRTSEPCRFRCRIAPGFPGFEQTLQITYGLACDGKANAQGMPKNPYELAYAFMISGTCLTGWMSVLQPVLNYLGQQAIKKGIAAELQRKYLKIW